MSVHITHPNDIIKLIVIDMTFRNVTREELENLYSHDGITRKELRYLLRIHPNQIPSRLAKQFESELNPFRVPENKTTTLRGFVHAPPKKLLQVFNSIHYQLLSENGQYQLCIVSTSPISFSNAIPAVVPKELATKRMLSQAHFTKITGSVRDISNYSKRDASGLFIIADEIMSLGFNELFSMNAPALKMQDLSEMLSDRLNTPKLNTDSIVLWFLGSPLYQGRAGGNAFSPISPFENKYKCDPKLINNFHNDLLSIPLPYFSTTKSIKSILEYNSKIKGNIKFFQAPELNYRYEKNLNAADKYLDNRTPPASVENSELNLSTTALELDSIRTRAIESFVQKPLVNAKVLNHTDLPILFTTDDLAIDESQNEVHDYSMEITHLLYQLHLKNPSSPFDSIETLSSVKHFMDNLQRALPELHGLMQYGILFDTSPIGGLGEHLTRISNSILRLDVNLTNQEAINKSEEFFIEMINKLFDEFDKPIKDLYYQLEEKRTERDQIKTHKLRNLINSILFELNNTYPDGWEKDLFEQELKRRGNYGAQKCNEIFLKLLEQKEVTETSPGLFWHIVGFDRYL